MKKKELYEQPLSQQIELQQEQLICASDLTSDETQGLEGFVIDTEGLWKGLL